jgi:hypothetical protein
LLKPECFDGWVWLPPGGRLEQSDNGLFGRVEKELEKRNVCFRDMHLKGTVTSSELFKTKTGGLCFCASRMVGKSPEANL